MEKLFNRKIKKKNIYIEPFQHIIFDNVMELKEYDKLYENMHYFTEDTFEEFAWSIWKKEYDIHHGKLLYDIQDLSYDNKCMALWFFTDRNERGAKKDIEIYSPKTSNNKIISRKANSFLFFIHNDTQQIRILPARKTQKFLRPCVQFNFPVDVFRELLNKYV